MKSIVLFTLAVIGSICGKRKKLSLSLSEIIQFCLIFIAVAVESKVENYLLGGGEVTIYDVPYLVSVRYYGSHECGGSIISNTQVLTTAYCFRFSDNLYRYSILAGSTSRFGDDNQQYKYMSRVIKHPNYAGVENDIALVTIVGSFKFVHQVRPIALPTQGEISPAGTIGTLSGWGRTWIWESPLAEKVRSANAHVFDYDKCKEYYSSYKEGMLCAGNLTKAASPCHGDYGNPLVAEKILIGMPTKYIACAIPRPSLYTRVSHYVDWIKANEE